MGKLHVGAADHADFADDSVGDFFQAVLQGLVDCQHWRSTE